MGVPSSRSLGGVSKLEDEVGMGGFTVLEGDCAVKVGEEDAFGLVFEGLWEGHDGGVGEVVLQQSRAIRLPSIQGAMRMRTVVQNEFGVAALRGFVEAHIQKNLLVGEGSASSEHVLFRPPSPWVGETEVLTVPRL